VADCDLPVRYLTYIISYVTVEGACQIHCDSVDPIISDVAEAYTIEVGMMSQELFWFQGIFRLTPQGYPRESVLPTTDYRQQFLHHRSVVGEDLPHYFLQYLRGTPTIQNTRRRLGGRYQRIE